ncbi:MAG: hypothetical protein HYZ75_14715 [Elusimicrobia bacterium]|nr:hypothetical protein [Elusimicrobiota bacterium]
MGIAKTEKSSFGPGLVLVILLVDVGLLIWGWHLYQRRQERLDDAGLNFNRAPEADVVKDYVPDEPEAPSGIDRYVKKESLGGDPAPRTAPPAAGTADPKSGPAAPPALPTTLTVTEKAVSYYYQLKRNPRFKNSRAIQGWKKDFLSYPDLKALNDGWKKNRDPIRFLVGMVKSPNFRTMTGKYLSHPDLQAFVKEMAGSPSVIASAPAFLADKNIKGAVGGLNLGAAAGPMKDSASALGAAKSNPALKGILEDAGSAPRLTR